SGLGQRPAKKGEQKHAGCVHARLSYADFLGTRVNGVFRAQERSVEILITCEARKKAPRFARKMRMAYSPPVIFLRAMAARSLTSRSGSLRAVFTAGAACSAPAPILAKASTADRRTFGCLSLSASLRARTASPDSGPILPNADSAARRTS